MDSPIRIMVVDDNQDFLFTMDYWLRSKGYKVTTAPNGKEAVDKLKKDPVDIVFLDLHMPVMDGVQTLKNIREFNQEIPVVIITAHTTDVKLTEVNKLGVSGFFAKDKDFSESLPLIESVLRRHTTLKEKKGEKP